MTIIPMPSVKLVQQHVKAAHLQPTASVVMVVLNLEFFQGHHAFAPMATLIQEPGLQYVNNVVTHVQHAQRLLVPVLHVQGQQLETQLPLAHALIGIMMMAITQIVWLAIIHVLLAQMEIHA